MIQTPLSKLILALDRHAHFRRMLSPHVDVPTHDVRIDDLTPQLDGFRILQISDVHVGDGTWHPVHVEEVRKIIHDASPDVIVNTGDYMQGDPAIDKVAAVVGRLMWDEDHSAPPPQLAILGNHDHYAGEEPARELVERLELMGVEMLLNRGVCIGAGARRVSFFGLSDEIPGFEEAVESLLTSGHPRVVLMHEPDLIDRLPAGTADLILSGHTHGGQITVPGLESHIVRAFCGSHYVAGFYRMQGNLMYVNRGLGYTGLPMRFRAAPEVTLFRLVR